jgi:hypothetical protein
MRAHARLWCGTVRSYDFRYDEPDLCTYVMKLNAEIKQGAAVACVEDALRGTRGRACRRHAGAVRGIREARTRQVGRRREEIRGAKVD